HVLPATKAKESLWSLFEDVYLCAVLICSVGLLCMCMFTVTVTCQYLHRKQRLKGLNFCISSSSGETVTSVISVSPALPKKQRRYRKKRSRHYQEETPPEIPAKVPIGDKRKPKLLKPQPRKVLL
ncbi:hypothetical protein NL108_016015, partial [Boleophthalmus pectinirostris]